MKNGTEVLVDRIPECDLCKYDLRKSTPAAYDGKTVRGPWGYMCEDHFKLDGIGLGVGKGQRLILDTNTSADIDTSEEEF